MLLKLAATGFLDLLERAANRSQKAIHHLGSRVRMNRKRGVEWKIYGLGQEALLRIYSDGFLFGDFSVSAKSGGGIVPTIFVA